MVDVDGANSRALKNVRKAAAVRKRADGAGGCLAAVDGMRWLPTDLRQSAGGNDGGGVRHLVVLVLPRQV